MEILACNMEHARHAEEWIITGAAQRTIHTLVAFANAKSKREIMSVSGDVQVTVNPSDIGRHGRNSVHRSREQAS